MTMVIGVKDDENKFDMMVRNCVAHDGTRAPIQLVDEKGCVSRPKIMSPFRKMKNFDSTANVLSFAYFQVPFIEIFAPLYPITIVFTFKSSLDGSFSIFIEF